MKWILFYDSSRECKQKVQNQLLRDDAEDIGGLPLDSKGRPCFYEGGACRNCSILTRSDMSDIANCPDVDKPDHYVQCTGCNNKKQHRSATRAEMYCALVRRFPEATFADYVKYYAENPLYKKGGGDAKKNKRKMIYQNQTRKNKQRKLNFCVFFEVSSDLCFVKRFCYYY